MDAQARSREIRRALPLGLLTTPLVNLATSSERRRELGQSAQGLVRDAQQIPSLDWGRLLSDTGQQVQQGIRDLPQTAATIANNLPQIAWEITGAPFVREEQAQRRLDEARMLSNGDDATQAARDANAALGGIVTNTAGFAGGGLVRTVPQAAGLAAALTAPNSLARDAEQPLQDRLPRALAETTGAAAFGGGAQYAVNAAPAISRLLPSRGAQMVQRMDRAGASVDASGAPQTPRGVTPSLATANQGRGVSAPATNILADNMIVGGPTRGRLRQSATELRDAVRDVRDAYGRARGRESAGTMVQQGFERFAGERGRPNPQPGTDPLRVSTREMGFVSKAQGVFDQALRPIEANPAQLTNTQAALGHLLQRADSPLVRAFNADPVLTRFRSTVTSLQRKAANGQPPTLRDLRELRRGIRESQGRVRVGPESVDNAALQQVESALSRDIYDAAGPVADRLRAADRYYARGRQRIDAVIRAFDLEGADPARSMQAIIRAANPRTENVRALVALRSALPDDEWRQVAASLIDEMGAPGDGAAGFVADQGFSVANFARAYRAMTPRARRVLFGGRGGQGGQSGRTMRQLADDLDNLAAVADAQKAVAAGANTSGSATHLQNIGSLLTFANPGTFGAGVFAAVVGVLTGEMLTNPAFVRWLVSAQTRRGGPAGIRRQLGLLRDLAARDPAIYPAVHALEAQLQDQQYTPAPGASGDRPGMPPPREPAFQ